ncbi:hypothetical protein BAUCODRAFT_576718 [Baudoinia panamericana UAMH 10762]|uniref:Thiolase-like protein type 1 additional C-terminal domain-containing protein n=1 Tax=Baudoinia panamericana (strain UAMH 10762) TaxID=717646 RepID=M2ND64_BAUPA|nr:uncharacterized protein BAUCODRAFT_576718 [Baudoinia panamericana UAMH 10762]EMC96860.1 hypothetical protein BAUCODRAFT_576718 [Baudoinia panamericana UAMH 10762]
MTRLRQTPIIVGVGDVVNRSRKIEDAVEPLELMLQAINNALQDTALDNAAAAAVQSSIDSIDIVRSWTWPYRDLPGLVADRLHVKPRRKHYSEHGGNQPGFLFDEAARRISKGEGRVAVLTGGEALASLTACASAKRLPPPHWTPVDEEVNSVFSPTTRELKANLGAKHGIGNPIQVYPLYENGFRAYRRQSIEDNNVESARLYSQFATVADGNRFAWSYGTPVTNEDGIGAVSGKNRMICFPYPLLMNAFNTVNLAAACIVTSTDYARELGIPESKWIYALGGAGTRDNDEFWKRPAYWWSPAISRSLDAGIEASALQKEDIDLFDFYSCFPIVPKLACEHLGLPIVNSPKPITLLGGLTSFGGAGNNYSMHAITEMTRQLRSGKGKTGLVLANGGVATYQHVVCLSRSPRRDGLPYPENNPLPAAITDVQVPEVDEQAEGDATVETYTVEFARDGQPAQGFVVGRLKKTGHRFVANHADDQTLHELCSRQSEPIGRSGRVSRGADGRNVFTFAATMARL